jgi:protein-S-isoprenylcysteine O-methyltransferase Ste14
MMTIVIFSVISAGIVYLSWSSLRDRQSHGFYRFFAFESILILILLNVEHWFSEPLAPRQILSWALLIGSLFLAVHGFRLLRVVGQPEGQIEDTTTLVTVGAYRYIRHPLYSSLLLLAWGTFFKAPSLAGLLLAGIVTASLVATARAEEAENLRKFGEAYAAYMETTRRFIPYLF